MHRVDRRFHYSHPVPSDDRTRIRAWADGNKYDLHGVRLRNDSLVGTRHWQPINCAQCEIVLSRTAIDSIHERTVATGRTKVLGLGAGAILVVFVAVMSQANFD